MTGLDGARRRIAELDDAIIELAAQRVAIGREVGKLKRQQQLGSVDYSQEKRVMARCRDAARRYGLNPAVAEDITTRMILESVGAQEADRVLHAATGAGRSVVVMGGAGRMGRWLTRFLASHGYDVAVMDPAVDDAENARAAEAIPEADLVLVATPPSKIAAQYDAWCNQPPRGVIADISSIKTPILEAIKRLQAAGGRVASFHPMFGPDVAILRDADVVICDTGDEAAGQEIAGLFAPTTARVVTIPVAEHDHIMAEVLTLGHAMAITFAAALSEEEAIVHSTTFQAMAKLAATVTSESPDVYFEIQSRNPHSVPTLARVEEAIRRLRTIAERGDREAFRALMEQGRLHLERRELLERRSTS